VKIIGFIESPPFYSGDESYHEDSLLNHVDPDIETPQK
jgi:hypothetical protein